MFSFVLSVKQGIITHNAVNTITGTAAWEAITGGKNALLFGKIWFDHFPGIFRYDDNVALHDIMSYRIYHSDLEEKRFP